MNDIERAISTLENYSPCSQKGLYEAHKVAISALEKQVPKKPILDEIDDWVCPTCKGGFLYPLHISPHEHASCNYCNECGQKLDWSEVENEA